MDLSNAVIEVTGLHSVRLSIPPWVIDAEVDDRFGLPILTQLSVINEREGITASSLSGLPIRHITRIAANAVWVMEETIYRALATRRSGRRSEPLDHYQPVLQVADWAARSGRKGGPAICVAQFWGVHERTARRWLAVASRVAGEPQTPESDPGQAGNR